MVRRTPLLLKHTSAGPMRGFAILSGLEAGVRGMLISVMPLTVYNALGSAALVSRLYFFVGLASLVSGLMVPWAIRFVPRRWMYTLGTALYLQGMTLAIHGGATATAFAVLSNALATVTLFVCLNAYVLDYVARTELGRCTSMQMVYSAASWSLGPVAGVWLSSLWTPAPFIVAGGFALALLAAFWALRLGNGREISRARRPAPNPLAYLSRFFAQPRLIAGWMFAVLRSCGWWAYVVYLPIFCVQEGLGGHVAGVALSASNAVLFATPLILRLIQRQSVRVVVRGAFIGAATCFVVATLAAPLPPLTVAAMMVGSVFLIALDVSAGLPFLMAVKPSERTEMAAVYSSFRDVSGILTPGVAWLVLLAAPVAAIFAAAGAGLGAAGVVAARMHPRLGAPRPSHGRALRVMPGE